MNNDKFSWLHRTGLPSNVSKGAEAASKPKSMSKPAGNTSKPAVNDGVQRGKSQRPPEAKQADPAMTAKRKSAGSANIEGNESAKYEKLEKKSLKGLKGGGTEKELRAGHNTGVKDTMKEFKAGTLHSGSKKGPKVTNPKQAIAIGLSEERKAKKGKKY